MHGFGFIFDIKTGTIRRYYIKENVKYWADDDTPVDLHDAIDALRGEK